VDPGERKLHLRLHARDLCDTESRGIASDVPEQRRLSDARLAPDDEDGALTLARMCQQPGEHFALAGPVEKPGRVCGGHFPHATDLQSPAGPVTIGSEMMP
jgi:hypothetical protein